MIKAYYDLGFRSRGIERVITQLDKYCPQSVEKVNTPDEADLVILHIIGRHDHVMQNVEHLLQQNKQVAMIQYALQSTRNPNPKDWLEIWNKAELVWSYYDLSEYCPDFYHAPLAADPETFFHVQGAEKYYLVGTIGESYKVECIGEVRLAAWGMQGKTVHVGNDLGADPNTRYYQNISDDELRVLYNASEWWSCLRRHDGFELGVVEALLCGTRPIIFDTPNYHQWFDGLATFVPECPPAELSIRLKKILQSGPYPVTEEEIQETKNRFNWEKIANGFWDRLLHK